jgi:hypothetical protein
MANDYVLKRLEGIRSQLMAAHEAGDPMSNSTKGREREAFINDFLRNVLPPIYRFGTGDATDVNGNRSGQLDVVVEYPFGPSLPLSVPTLRPVYILPRRWLRSWRSNQHCHHSGTKS